MTPRPDVSQKRKDQILDAASEVFIEKCFQKARMEDIASISNLSKGAIYWYFKSKDSIVIALLNRIFSREADDIHSILSAGMHSSDCILAY
jgi:AcrR family transcriptional regulator